MDNGLNFRPTVEWMRLKYDELNKGYFNNSLGSCNFSIFKTGRGASGNVLGYFKLTGGYHMIIMIGILY